jgi:outer membrane protein
MLKIVNSIQHLLRLPLLATLISGRFGPVFYYSPICPESRILARLLSEGRPKPSDIQQLWDVVYIVLCRVFRRELVLIRLSSNASLESTFDGVARNIVRAGVSSCLEQGQSIVQPLGRQVLEFGSVHPRHQDNAIGHLGLNLTMSSISGGESGERALRRQVLNYFHILHTQDGRKALAGMQAKFEPMRIGMEKRQAEMQTLAEQLRKGGATMTAEAQQKISNELAAKKKIFDRDADDLNTEVEQEDGRVMQDLTVKMGGVIDEYAKQNGYTVVMDAAQPVLWAAEAANITPDIVKLYDQKHPVAAPAPAAKK